MDELKPCPFCGGKMFVEEGQGGYYFVCYECATSLCIYPTRDAAIAAANRRADDQLKERVCETLKRIMPDACYAGEARAAADCDGCELRDGCDRYVALKVLAEWQGEAGE